MNNTVTSGPTADASSLGRLEELVARIIDRATELGASQAEAAVSMETGLSATVRMGDVDTLEYHRDRGIVVSVYFGQTKGSASSADISDQAIEETVAKACSIARHTAADQYAGLAPAERMFIGPLPDLELAHDWALTPEQAIELATTCEQAARDSDKRIQNSEGATVSTHRRAHVYGNTHGLAAGYPTTYHSMSCSVVGRDAGGMQRDYWYTAARDPGDLRSAEYVGRTAAERTVRRLGARKLSTRTAAVVFPPYLARGLIGHFLGAIQGGSQYRKTSFLLGADGQQVFPDWLQIHERPLLKKGMGSTAMDREGVATAPRELVSDGVVQGYILGSYSARKLGLETTGNAGGVHNILVPGDETLDERALLRQMGSGLLVTELIGQGVNPTTGDYSRGAAGFWVENGELAFPVHEITIAGNLKDMYRQIVAVAGDWDEQSNVRCGAVLLDKLTIAGD